MHCIACATCYFAGPAVIDDTVGGLEVPVHQIMFVEVCHAASYVCQQGKPASTIIITARHHPCYQHRCLCRYCHHHHHHHCIIAITIAVIVVIVVIIMFVILIVTMICVIISIVCADNYLKPSLVLYVAAGRMFTITVVFSTIMTIFVISTIASALYLVYNLHLRYHLHHRYH